MKKLTWLVLCISLLAPYSYASQAVEVQELAFSTYIIQTNTVTGEYKAKFQKMNNVEIALVPPTERGGAEIWNGEWNGKMSVTGKIFNIRFALKKWVSTNSKEKAFYEAELSVTEAANPYNMANIKMHYLRDLDDLKKGLDLTGPAVFYDVNGTKYAFQPQIYFY
jgi:hypothetical protein